MSKTNIKLSERQLAELFKKQTVGHTTATKADDCLAHTAASSARLKHVEAMANDYTAAQGMKASLALQEWSDLVSASIEKSRRSWFSFLGFSSPLKTTMATAAFAVAFAFALPVVTQFNTQQNNSTPMSYQAAHGSNFATQDLINSIPFEGPADQLSRGSFDTNGQTKPKDQLFDASFG